MNAAHGDAEPIIAGLPAGDYTVTLFGSRDTASNAPATMSLNGRPGVGYNASNTGDYNAHIAVDTITLDGLTDLAINISHITGQGTYAYSNLITIESILPQQDPILDTPQSDLILSTNSSGVISSNFSDVNVGDTLTYTITPNIDLVTGFSFDTNTGDITHDNTKQVASAIEYTILCSDGQGGTPAADTFTIEVVAPSITLGIPSNLTPKEGDMVSFPISDGTGPYTLDYNGNPLTIDSQNASNVDVIWPNIRTLIGTNFNTNYPVSIVDSSDSASDTVDISTLVSTGGQTSQISEIDGIYLNDIDVVVGDYSYAFDLVGDLAVDLSTGLVSVGHSGGSFSYTIYDVSLNSWSGVESVNYNAIPIPTITVNPTNGTIQATDVNSVKIFSISATDISEELTYQWEYSDDDVNYNDISGATSSTLEVSGDEFTDTSNSGRRYRCKVTNISGTSTSTYAILTISGANLPSIVSQPISGTIQATNSSSSHIFTIGATGATSYQWQYLVGSTWTNISGATSTSYSINGSLFQDIAESGRQYRCRVTNATGTVNSNTAILTITAAPSTAPVITSQPSSGQVQALNSGSSHGFSVIASNATSYQWEFSDNAGSTYSNLTGAVSASLIVVGSSFPNTNLTGRLYRCKVTNAVGTTTSASATLTITSASAVAGNFIISSSNPVVDENDALVTYTYPIWELWNKIPEDPTAIIIDSGTDFSVVAGVGSIPVPNGVIDVSYIFIARDSGDNPANYIRTKDTVK